MTHRKRKIDEEDSISADGVKRRQVDDECNNGGVQYLTNNVQLLAQVAPGSIDSSRLATLHSESVNEIRWICGDPACTGWTCSVKTRFMYPEIVGCCGRAKRMRKCEDCGTWANFNYLEFKWPMYCVTHRKPGMINVKNRTCLEDTCDKQPAFNVPGSTKGLYCVTHRKPGMIDVVSRTCLEDACDKRPVFNVPGSTKGLYCVTHRKPGMIDVISRTCLEDTCDKQPVFNVPGLTTGLYCAVHRKPGMINVKNRTCLENTCDKRPVFNVPGSTTGLYCVTHRKPGMIDVVSRTCLEDTCDKRPVFNDPGLTTGLYCAVHRKPGMIDVKNRTCLEDTCDKIPVFNIPGSPKGLYCVTHRKPGMIDVKNRTCLEDTCDKQPAFNVPGSTTGLYCAAHRKPGMINVVSRTCLEDTCDKIPAFNTPSGALDGLYCAEHRKPGMVKNPRKKCVASSCSELATHGHLPPKPAPYDNVATHCDFHYEPGMVNIHNRPCAKCSLMFILNSNNECYYCDPGNFSVHVKAKERKVKEYLDINSPIKYNTHDASVNTINADGSSCGKERPDFLFDCGTHFVILEVDENQHLSRPCECEQVRMINISQALGMPTVFIRYNPDSYKKPGETKRRAHEKHSTRMKEVIKWITHLSDINNMPLSLQKDTAASDTAAYLSVLYLYFDADDHSNELTVLS